MIKLNLFNSKKKKHISETPGYIDSDPAKCVQCGICSYNCPIGIDVRAHVWDREPMNNTQCITCGKCVALCPRGVLQFVATDVLSKDTIWHT
jgi:ferredoxin